MKNNTEKELQEMQLQEFKELYHDLKGLTKALAKKCKTIEEFLEAYEEATTGEKEKPQK